MFGLVPLRVWLIAGLLAAAASWFGYNSYTKTQAVNALQKHRADLEKRQAVADAIISQKEQALGRLSTESKEELQKRDAARTAAVRGVEQRLRNVSAAWAASAATSASAAACRADGAPAAAVLPDETRRDLVTLADDAEKVKEQLDALQGWVKRAWGVLQSE